MVDTLRVVVMAFCLQLQSLLALVISVFNMVLLMPHLRLTQLYLSIYIRMSVIVL